MFYDKTGKTINVGNKVKFNDSIFVISKINGDNYGEEGTSTVDLIDYTPDQFKGDLVPCENNIELV